MAILWRRDYENHGVIASITSARVGNWQKAGGEESPEGNDATWRGHDTKPAGCHPNPAIAYASLCTQ